EATVHLAAVGRGWGLRWWAGVAGCGVGKAVGVGVVGGTVVGSAVVGRALEVAAVEALVGVAVGGGVVGGAAVGSAVVGRGWVLRWWAGVAGGGGGEAVGVGVVGGTVVGSAVVGRALEVAAVKTLVGVGHGRVTTAQRVTTEGPLPVGAGGRGGRVFVWARCAVPCTRARGRTFGERATQHGRIRPRVCTGVHAGPDR